MEFTSDEVAGYDQTLVEKKATDKLSKTQRPNRVQKRSATDKKCTSCGTTSTPVWRWGGESKEVLLCNACSLRIRRSASRPHRGKSPGLDQPSQKQSSNNVSSDSGSPTSETVLAELKPNAATIRQFVLMYASREKARLLGAGELATEEEDWHATQRGHFAGPSAAAPLHAPPIAFARGYYRQPPAMYPAYVATEPARHDYLPMGFGASYSTNELGPVRLF